LLGAAAGVSAMLATCATGHPLLVNEAAFPFWIQFALAFGLAQSSLMNADVIPDRRQQWRASGRLLTIAAAAAIVLAALTSAARGLVEPPASRGVNGLFEWETADDGRRSRWTEQYASLFVPGHVSCSAAADGRAGISHASVQPTASVAARPNVDGHMNPIGE